MTAARTGAIDWDDEDEEATLVGSLYADDDEADDDATQVTVGFPVHAIEETTGITLVDRGDPTAVEARPPVSLPTTTRMRAAPPAPKRIAFPKSIPTQRIVPRPKATISGIVAVPPPAAAKSAPPPPPPSIPKPPPVPTFTVAKVAEPKIAEPEPIETVEIEVAERVEPPPPPPLPPPLAVPAPVDAEADADVDIDAAIAELVHPNRRLGTLLVATFYFVVYALGAIGRALRDGVRDQWARAVASARTRR